MRAINRISLASLSLLILLFMGSCLLFFKLSTGLDLYPALTAIRERAFLACTYRCLGLLPFLPSLLELGRLLLLVLLAFATARAVVKVIGRIRRTQNYDRAVEKRVKQTALLFSDLDPVRIFEDLRALAFVAGFFRPKIYLSTGLVKTFEQNELRAVVAHESCHKKKKDPLRSLLLGFLADFLFFIPLAGHLKKSFLLASEIKADWHCRLHNVDPLEIACGLIKAQRLQSLAASWFFDQNRERIKGLLGQPIKATPPLSGAIISFVLIIVFGFFSFAPVKKAAAGALFDHEKSCAVHRINP